MTSTRRLSAILGWLLVFLALAALAPLPPVLDLDRAAALLLAPLGRRWVWLQGVWIAGGVLLTGLAVAGLGLRRRPPWGLWAGFLAGSLVEVALKHLLVLPRPHPLPAPAPWPALIAATNLDAVTAAAWLHHWLPQAGPVRHLLAGSFPSGHLFRLSYVTGAAAGPRRRALLWGVAATAALAVTATGGHWIWDAAGGYALARFCLSLAGQASVSRKASAPR
ncbi:MAG: hypothetical protein OWV35_01945 [Firmicutes bacterium]|nr:hypothetical protein [Bacillota bacterium]